VQQILSLNTDEAAILELEMNENTVQDGVL
jgi:hypothetical protein